MKKNYKRLLILILLIVVVLTGSILLLPSDMLQTQNFSGLFPALKEKLMPQKSLPSPDDQHPVPEPEPVDIHLASVGDILIHNTLYFAAYDHATQTYDFKSQLQYVKPYLERADITVANLETTLSGPEAGYAGYPNFNSPDAVADALKYAGVDIVTAANNHRFDTGANGFYRTIRAIRERQLDIIGVKAAEQEKTYVIKDINGIQTAFLNFGYGYPRQNGSLDINGMIMPASMSGLIDTFDPQSLDQATAVIAGRIAEAKEAGARLVVLFMHWGHEYHRQPNDFQKALAQRLADLGADVIFGGHPHVLQPAVVLTSAQGQKVPVFYSQGNFISDQRKETVNDIYTEQGIIAQVTFRFRGEEGPDLINADAIPTWVNKKIINGRYVYEVIPVPDALRDKDQFPLLNNQDLERIRFCDETVKTLTTGLGR